MPIDRITPLAGVWGSGQETALERAHGPATVHKVSPPSEEYDGPVGGAHWVGHTHFHDMNDETVLDFVAAAVSESVARGERPVVVFDLDSTLYDNDRRTLRIIREWASSEDAARFPAVQAELADTELFEVGYSVADLFRAQGLELAEPEVALAYQSAKAFWLERFFDGAYLGEDTPYAGALSYVEDLYAAGANIVYLTGRDRSVLGDATHAVLERDGFPTEQNRTWLILKNDDDSSDAEFKRQAGIDIARLGTVVATFDNEPGNVMVFEDVFPRAINVFVHTDCSEKPATPGRAVHYIRGFARA